MIFCKGTEIAPHVKMERLVVVIHCAKVPIYDDFSVERFVIFSDERPLLRFAWFDLAAGKLPAAFELAIASLRRQNALISLDNSCYYVSGFHSESF